MAEHNGDAGYRITLGIVYEMLQAQNKLIAELSTTQKLMDQRLNTALLNTKELSLALEKEREMRLAAEQSMSEAVTRLRIRVYGAVTTLVLALGAVAARLGT